MRVDELQILRNEFEIDQTEDELNMAIKQIIS